tara:strand:+ start:391 stop:630 length:240 start_codon:yes stop_codon:yes gene_type:complete
MKRNELKQKYHKETLCYYKDQNGLINKEYMNWLEDELIRQLTLPDVVVTKGTLCDECEEVKVKEQGLLCADCLFEENYS